MSAKEMFEELKYEYHECDDRTKGKYIYYLKANCIPNKLNTKYINFTQITFALNGFKIEHWQTDAYINRIKDFHSLFITNEELQAINKQVDELGWNNE